uniref:CHK domain-containing protein n=1 Tax=Syphacia muris TaxID=451379 RepID=A0A0N5AZK0_9BILA
MFDDMFKGSDANVSDMLEAMSLMQKPGHNAEVSFYELYMKSGINARIPKMYFGEKFSDTCSQGILILEDVGTDSAISKLFETLSADEIKQVLKSLAALNAFSLKHPEFINIGEVTMASVMSNFTKKDILGTLLKSSTLGDERLTELYNKLMEYESVLKDLSVFETVAAECGLPSMLVHGDLWSSNVMWKKNVDGTRNLAGIVDWQLYAHAMSQILPVFGTIGEANLVSRFPDRKDEVVEGMKRKTKGLLEDILINLKKNYLVKN